jgi:hypothetical protein
MRRPERQVCSRSEKTVVSEQWDWGIGHARKDWEAQEMGQSASFILAPSLWAQCVWESSNAPALKGSLLWVRKVQDEE